MKIAVASEGQTSESIAATNAGRAPYYLIFKDKKLIETLKNPFLEDAGGAGVNMADLLIEKDVEKVVAGQFGGKMSAILEEAGIAMQEASDEKIADMIQ